MDINFDFLKKRAFNMRWAQVEDGVIPLTAADHDLKVHADITRAIQTEIEYGHFPYSPACGLLDFQEAVAGHFRRHKSTSFSAQCVLATNSAASAIQHFYDYFLKEGDEVLVQNPVDFLLAHCAEKAGGKVVRIPTNRVENNAESVTTGWENFISPKTKILAICHPHNPLGFYYSSSQLKEIAQFARKNNLIILSDEVWSDVVIEGNFCSMRSVEENCWVVYGLSKGFGLAGLRIGALICPTEQHRDAIALECGYVFTTEGASTLSQMAAVAALNAPAILTGFISDIKPVLECAAKGINEIAFFETSMPCATFVLWIRHPANWDSEKLVGLIEQEAKVKLVPGMDRWFGPAAQGFIRMSCATHLDIMKEAIHRLQNWAAQQKDFQRFAK
jgi:aspartate/methionine/tyrosine aminotransferase